MAIAPTLKDFLDQHHVDYETLEHCHTECAMDSARHAHIPLHQMAKAVVLEDGEGYVVSILPANNRLNLGWVREELQRKVRLAPEPELEMLFDDCERGAVPALCLAYGLDGIWDDHLKHVSDVYIEAGDHEHLVHLQGPAFRRLLSGLPHSIISASEDFSIGLYE